MCVVCACARACVYACVLVRLNGVPPNPPLQVPVLSSHWVGFADGPKPPPLPPFCTGVDAVLAGCCALCLQPIPLDSSAPDTTQDTMAGEEGRPGGLGTPPEFVPRLNRVEHEGEAYHAMCGNFWFALA
jgi:hypothetical protein